MVSLGEVCEFRYGKALTAAQRREGTVPVYGSNGQVGLHSDSLTSGPTVIVGRKGSFGEVHYSRVPCWPIDTTYFVDTDATDMDLKWLANILRQLHLKDLNRSAAVPGLNREDAYRRRLLLPPLSEQQRMVAILDQAEDLRLQQQEILAEFDALIASLQARALKGEL